METLIEETKFIMKKYNIRANKSLGQNFLISEQVVNEIVESSKIDKEDLVIEIGPGLGTLTKYLLEKAGKVIGIELDKKMVEILQDRFKLYNNFELYQQDVLKIDLKHLIKKEKENTNQAARGCSFYNKIRIQNGQQENQGGYHPWRYQWYRIRTDL